MEDALKKAHEQDKAGPDSQRFVIEEQVRSRIASDLHDGLGVKLSAAKMRLSTKYENASHPQTEELLRDVFLLLDEIHRELRNSLFQLSPSALQDGDLQQALERFMAMLTESCQLDVCVDVDENVNSLAAETASQVFRIVQELVNNTLKHADARSVSLSCWLRNDEIILEYTDDGRGFDLAGIQSESGKKSYGLRSIIDRAKLLRGELSFESKPGDGVYFRFTAPANRA